MGTASMIAAVPFASGVWSPSPDIRPLERSDDPRVLAAEPAGWLEQKRAVMQARSRGLHIGAADGADVGALDRVLRRLASIALRERPERAEPVIGGVRDRLSGSQWRSEADDLYLERAADGAGSNPGLWDSVALLMAEDLAIVHWDEASQSERLEYVHVCFPSAWDPSSKLGRSFASVHEPVANAERVRQAGAAMMRMCTLRGPFIRWAWGLHTDGRLNHHPLTGRACDEPDTDDPAEVAAGTWLRLERQVLLPFPEVSRTAFLIGVYVYPLSVLTGRAERDALASTLRSMPPEALAYKSLMRRRDPLVRWLESGF